MTVYGQIAVVLIPIPPIALVLSLVASSSPRLTGIARARWRVVAWLSGFLSLGSIALVVLIVYALKHLD